VLGHDIGLQTLKTYARMERHFLRTNGSTSSIALCFQMFSLSIFCAAPDFLRSR
jgi:hypothetical protein